MLALRVEIKMICIPACPGDLKECKVQQAYKVGRVGIPALKK